VGEVAEVEMTPAQFGRGHYRYIVSIINR